VTLYGIVDLGVGYQKIKANGDSASKFGMNSGNQSGSRWGLRGTEDLGGGTRAVFTLESGFTANDGRSAQNGRLFGRQATVGLANDAWGQLDLGRQTNIASKYFASIDPFGASFGLANIGHGFSSANTTRYDNMVMYQTPSYAGFQVGAGYSFNTSNSGAGGFGNAGSGQGFRTNNNNRAITAGIRYVNGPLNVAAAYDQLNPASNQVGDGSTAKIRSYLVGGSYDFEVVKLALAWGQTRNGWIQSQDANVLGGGLATGGDSLSFGNGLSRDGFRASSYLVGATVPLGAATNLFGSWQRIDPKNNRLTGDDETSNSYSLGLTYDLSKRTNLYAYGNYTTDYAFQDGVKATTGIVGVRHRF
ncbi:MAG: porin, partial [Burkholderiaceae bacterium]